MKICSTLLFFALSILAPSFSHARPWTSLDGKTVEAEFIKTDGKNITIRRNDGRVFTIELATLSPDDQEFVAQQAKGTETKEDDHGVTGDIRSPRKGEKVDRHFEAKGRTRGVPDGYVTMLFRAQLRGERYSFPHGEILDSNRSFSTKIYHEGLDHGKWKLTLHALPKSNAEKLVLWAKDCAIMVKAGRKEDIEGFDPALIEKAIKIGEVEYELKAR